MKNFLFNLKIITIKLLIPSFVKYKAFKLLSFLFILSLTKIKSTHTKKNKFKVIILSKSGGIDDVIESQKKYYNNCSYLLCPRIFLITIFNSIFTMQEYSNSEKFYSKERRNKREEYKKFLVVFLKVLKKKYNFNAFIGFNLEFKEEIELSLACENLKIPFLLLYKESVLSFTEIQYLRHLIKKLGQKFYGYKIAVYSDYAKKILTESNFVKSNKVIVTGCPRLNQSFTFKKTIPKNQILYYAIEKERGLANLFIKLYGNNIFKDLKEHKKYDSKFNWNFLHIQTVKILKKFAIKNPDVSIVIKVKTGQSNNKKLYSNLPNNIKLQYFGVGHKLLEKSKLIIAWNTTAILEGIAANRFILIPYFHKKRKLSKKNELILKLKNKNYGYSENDFLKKLNFFIKTKYKKQVNNNHQYSLKYHLGNSDQNADYRLSEFIKNNIKFN